MKNKFFALVVRTPRGLTVRGYKNKTTSEAIRKAQNKADCLDVLKTTEIEEEEYNELIVKSGQQKISYSAAHRVCHQKDKSISRQRGIQ